MTETAPACSAVDDHMSDIIDGVAPDALFDHVAGCERCRDARFAAEQVIAELGQVAADYRFPEQLEARLMAALDEQATGATGATGAAVERPARPELKVSLASRPRASHEQPGHEHAAPHKRWAWLSLAAAALLGGVWLSSRAASNRDTEQRLASGAWRGQVLQVERAFGSQSGLSSCPAPGPTAQRAAARDCKTLAAGDWVLEGSRIETDGLTRARLRLGDGTLMALDRASQLELNATEARRGRLHAGNLVLESDAAAPSLGNTRTAGASRAVLDVPTGRIEVFGTKLALRAQPDLARVEVSRGEVKLSDAKERSVWVRAGEAGQIGEAAEPSVESVLDLAHAMAWSESAFDPTERTESHAALGELTGKRPQVGGELRGAVRLVEHHVRVRIVDNIARTEIEEIFANQTDDVLEGIYRFPLPSGAQIEQLSLDVDGQLSNGAFVDRERAAAIWRGAVVNAGGKKPPPEQEIVWVPGPWKDPALLEWQRGNRFELRIFPIPKRGSRRIVLAYTQVLAPSDGGRQYVYPLPLDPGDGTRIERFTFEAQLRGHDPGHGVVAQGYALQPQSGAPDVARLAFEAQDFTPLGDLALSYRLENADARLRAWAYQPSEVPADVRIRSTRPGSGAPGVTGGVQDPGVDRGALQAAVPEDAAYVAITIRPDLPRRTAREARDYVLIADSSRSMLGENYRRALGVVTRTIREMDRHDRVTVLACDSVCQALPGGFLTPGNDTADLAGRFLSGVEPEGASDLAFAVEQAAALGRPGEGRVLRVVYVGDGTPSVGPIHPALIQRAVADALPRGATLSAVALGSDADHATLRVATQAGGGVSLTFAPGQSAEEVAYALLGATYGQTLQNARIELPDGMVAVAPSVLGSLAAGAEQLVVARLLRPRIAGQVVLAGQVAGERFEQSYPIEVSATSGQANAFVPRLYAAVAIAELEGSMDEGARRRSIELSTRFNVASRYTSLLVLESPAMFKAFGLDNQRTAPLWGGEQASDKSEQAASVAQREEEDDAAGTAYSSGAAPAAKRASSGADPSSRERAANEAGDAAAPSAARRSKPRAPASSEPEGSSAPPEKKSWPDDDFGLTGPELGREDQALPLSAPAPRRLIPMRKVWDRAGRIDAPPSLLEASSPARRLTLETRSRQQADHRSAIKDLYVVDFLAGDLESAARSVERWLAKDPLDPDALTARADLAAQRGLRDLAIRRLGSVVDVRPGDYKAQWRLARLHRWAGDPARGCRHSLGVAQLMLRDPKLVAQALSCAREVGQTSWVTDLLAALDPETRREVLRRDALPKPSEGLTGDFRIVAKWQGTEHDLDLVIIHPEGYRVSWLGAPTASVISANDVLSRQREALALRGAPAGQYAIELVRSNDSHGTIHGNVDIDVGDSQRNVAFVMDGDRLRVATARISLKSRLVPLPGWDDRFD